MIVCRYRRHSAGSVGSLEWCLHSDSEPRAALVVLELEQMLRIEFLDYSHPTTDFYFPPRVVVRIKWGKGMLTLLVSQAKS